MFCDQRPGFTVSAGSIQEFVCAEHLGPLIATWMVADEVTVVRL